MATLKELRMQVIRQNLDIPNFKTLRKPELEYAIKKALYVNRRVREVYGEDFSECVRINDFLDEFDKLHQEVAAPNPTQHRIIDFIKYQINLDLTNYRLTGISYDHKKFLVVDFEKLGGYDRQYALRRLENDHGGKFIKITPYSCYSAKIYAIFPLERLSKAAIEAKKAEEKRQQKITKEIKATFQRLHPLNPEKKTPAPAVFEAGKTYSYTDPLFPNDPSRRIVIKKRSKFSICVQEWVQQDRRIMLRFSVEKTVNIFILNGGNQNTKTQLFASY